MASDIPVYDQRLGFDARAVTPVQNNITTEMDAIAEFSFKQEENAIKTRVQNSLLEFQKLAYDNIDQVYERNKTNPDNLQKELKSLQSNLLGAVPAAARQKADTWFSTASRPYISKAREGENRMLTDQAAALSLQQLERSNTTLNAISGNLYSKDPGQRDEALMLAGEQYQSILTQLSTQNANGEPLYSEVDKVKYLSNLRSNVAIAGIKEHFDSSTPEEKIQLANEFNERKVNINIGGEEINVANALDRGEFESVRNYMASGLRDVEKQFEAQNMEELFQKVKLGQAQPLTGQPSWDKFINDKFTSMIPALVNAPDEQRIPEILDYFKKFGVPSTGVNMLKGWLDMGDEGQVKTMVNIVKGLQDDPESLSKLDSKTFNMAQDLYKDLEAGNNFQNAYESEKFKYSPKTRDQYKMVENTYNEEVSTWTMDTWRNKMVDSLPTKFFGPHGWIFDTPKSALTGNVKIDSEAMYDYQRILKQQFILTGDIGKAEASAEVYFNGLWQLSPANGGRLTKAAPEKYFTGPPNKPNFIREQYEEFLIPILKHMGITEKDAQENCLMNADNQTMEEIRKNKPPTYQVYVMDDFGAWFTIDNLRFAPKSITVKQELKDENRPK